jgi:hypothetical protein
MQYPSFPVMSAANHEINAPAHGRRSSGFRRRTMLLCSLMCSTPAMADNHSTLPIGIEAVPLVEPHIDTVPGSPAPNDLGAARWGPRRGMTDASTLAPRGSDGASLYAYVDLGSALPARLRELIGQTDGGVTMDLRASPGQMIGPALGSMVRWRMNNDTQLSLRLRGGKLRLVYGLRF